MSLRSSVLAGVLLATLLLIGWNAVHRGVLAPGSSGSGDAADEPSSATAFDLVAYPSHIADAAAALGGFQGHLDRMAGSWLPDLGIDVHVASENDADRPINELAPKLFRAREVGAEAPTGGILILLNPVRSEARIEVSYELEGIFPDAFVGRLADDQLVPYVSYGFAGMAVMDILHYLKEFAYLEAIRGGLDLQESYRTRPEFLEKAAFLSGGAGARADLAALPVDADLKAPVPEAKRGTYAPGKEPLQSVEAFERVLADLAGDPTLELFTAGSRIQRASYPVAPFEFLSQLDRLRDSKPLHVVRDGDWTVVDSESPAHGFIPVLLHREHGFWRVDLVETYKNLRFDSDGNYFLVNANTPYAFGLGAYGDPDSSPVEAWDLDGLDLEEVVATLETRKDRVSRYMLAELLYLNCFATMDAFRIYQELAHQYPRDPLIQKTLADRALFVGLTEIAIPALERLGSEAYLKLAGAQQSVGNLEAARALAIRAVEQDPFRPAALQRLASLLEKTGRGAEAAEVWRRLARVKLDDKRRPMPVELSFDLGPTPSRPAEPAWLGDRPVLDHSITRVTMTNRSGRPVEIVSTRVATALEATQGDVEEIRSSFAYPMGGHRIPPGESAALAAERGIGIAVARPYSTYVFDVCWRGVDGGVEQCRTQRVTPFAETLSAHRGESRPRATQ